ncbi:MAG: HAD-IB family phosphatase [Candidatus Devosia euplotis]|nr:HAD-IB family phosphatase [Candidatus Devosia euplotis]
MTTALFDFDGTLLPQRNSLMWHFARCLEGPALRRRTTAALSLALARSIPAVVAGTLDDEGMYRNLVRAVFTDLPVDTASKGSGRLAAHIERSLYPRMRETLAEHAGDRCLLVSANVDALLQGFCLRRRLDCGATRLRVLDGRYTGELGSAICRNEHKVERLKELAVVPDSSVAYGNSAEDLPMLRFAGRPVLVNPEPALGRAEGMQWAPRIFALPPSRHT